MSFILLALACHRVSPDDTSIEDAQGIDECEWDGDPATADRVRPFGWSMGRDRQSGAPELAPPTLVRGDTPLVRPVKGSWFAYQMSGPNLFSGQPGGEALMAVAGVPEDNDDPAVPNSYYIGIIELNAQGVQASSDGWAVPTSDWDAHGQNSPSVHWTGERWEMWYHGVRWSGEDPPEGDEDQHRLSVGRAWSDDGWTWEPDPANPLLSPTGDPADPDEALVGHPVVIRSPEGLLEMWYAAGRDLGFALSDDDGATWTRYCHNPVISGEGLRLKTPEVRWTGQEYQMSFASGDEHAYDILWAQSLDGVNWTVSEQPLIARGDTGWDADSVSNGQIVDGGLIYAGVGPAGSGVGFAEAQ